MNHPHIASGSGLWSRDGHLTMLTLDRFDAGELDVDSCEQVIEHLRNCSMCSARLEDIQAPGPALSPPQPTGVAGRIQPHRGPRIAVAVASTLAAAALLFLVGWPSPEQASRIAPDSELTVSAYTSTTASVDEAQAVGIQVDLFAGSQRLRNRDYVPADTTLSMNVETAAAGFVTVLTVSPPVEDDGGTGGVAEMGHDVVLPLQAIGSATSVELGSEPVGYGATQMQRVVAIYCPDPFEVSSGPNGYEIVGETIAENCETVEFELTRTADAADS